MTESSLQPTAGSLSAIVHRACQLATCEQYQAIGCPKHAYSEDLGVIAIFTEAPNGCSSS